MQERSDVLQLLEDLRVVILLDELHQLLVYLLDVRYFFLVCIHYLFLVHQPLLLSLVLSLKLCDDVLLLLFDLPL